MFSMFVQIGHQNLNHQKHKLETIFNVFLHKPGGHKIMYFFNALPIEHAPLEWK